jgi:hypothetical protein
MLHRFNVAVITLSTKVILLFIIKLHGFELSQSFLSGRGINEENISYVSMTFQKLIVIFTINSV